MNNLVDLSRASSKTMTGIKNTNLEIGKNKPEIDYPDFRQIIEIFLFVLICGLILKLFVLNFSLISSNSMFPALKKGDIVLISRLEWFAGLPGEFSGKSSGTRPDLRLWYKSIKKGEICAFKPDPFLNMGKFSENEILVKRVAGVPGDYVKKSFNEFQIVNGFETGLPNIFIIPGKLSTIAINVGNAGFYKPYIESEGSTIRVSGQKLLINGVEQNSYKFKRNYYFMSGDNAGVSYDSRYFGLVPSSGFVGKPLIILWNSEYFGSILKRIK